MGGVGPVRATWTEGGAASVLAPYLASAQRRWLAEAPGARWRRRPASLVFGDISGFTALSERLAAHGKVGAEDLTDVLDAAVGRLLDAAATHGGDLLKYGGDAVLLAFEGPGHERRAVQAAAALPGALRGPAEGEVQLSMSIGVATGELDLFLVGGDHRELVVCGPLVSRTVRLEHEAAADEVLVDGTTAAAVNDARWSGPDRGGHLLLLPPPPSTVSLGAAGNGERDLDDDDLLAGVPVGLRRRLGTGRDGEHRQVAMAFVQVLGVDDLLAEAGHEAVAEALDAVVRTAQAGCALHRTTFLSSDGDDGAVKLILTAGAPDAGTDDIGRLLLVARAVAATDCALAVRVGVHHGRAFAVEVGNDRRRVYTVLGDAVNLAARVMGRSEPGTVLATDSSLLDARTRFAATNLEPFMVKGKTDPVLASVVGPPLGGAAPGASRTPLVGRRRERKVLLDALDAVRGGEGRAVVISGDAGIGKSRLVAEVVAAAPDLPRLHITGGAYAVGSPYFAVRAALRQLLDLDLDADDAAVVSALLALVGPGGEPWLPLLAPAFGVTLADTATTAPVEARFRRARSHALVTDLLRRLLPDRALLVVEDAHWLDDSSTELLHHLLGAFAGVPWLVVISRRDQDGGLELDPSSGAERIDLAPLGLADAAALLHGDAADRFPHWVLDALVERGGGNPLFLEQLRDATRAGAEVESLPATVEAVIAARIDTLDPLRRRHLRTASVLGQRFPIRLLEEVIGELGVMTSLGAFLEPEQTGWARFEHALVRDGAYEGLSYRMRRELHGRVGDLIEADPASLASRAELLSLHFTEGQRWGSAWRWSVLAAERAAASEAPVEAARFFRRAVRSATHLAVPDAELSHVYERLADAEELNGSFDDAADALTRARRLASDDRVRVAHLLQRHGRICDRAGRYVAAQRWFGRGLQALDEGPPTADSELVRVDIVVARAGTRMRQGRLQEAVALLEEVVPDAEALGHRRAVAAGCNLLSTLLHDLGRIDDAAALLDRTVPVFEELGDRTGQADAHNNRGVEAYYDGDWDSAAARWRRAATLYEQAGDVVSHAMMLSNRGEVLSDRGELDEAEELFRAALAVARACRFAHGIGYILSNLGRLLTRAGRYGEAADALRAARDQFEELAVQDLVIETDVREAERRLAAGDADGAAVLADGVRATAARGESRFLLAGIERVAGLAAAQHGRWDEAVERLEASVEAARNGALADLAWGHDALAKVSAAAGQMARSWQHREAADEAMGRLGIRRVLEVPLPAR